MTRQRRTSRPQSAAADPSGGERIAKLLARAGIASRRGAEAMIAEGRVSVDGRVLDTPAVKVRPGQDVRIDGAPLPLAEPPRLYRYHKPTGELVTRSDPKGRPTIYDRLPEELRRLMPVGRLDFNSEGLLLLTNDGELKRTLELPATGWTRRYRARAHGRATQADLDRLSKGITVDGERFGPIHASLESRSKETSAANMWITLSLKEGRNREVRRALETLGLTVNRLIRVAYGPFQLGALRRGEVAEVPGKIVREQLGSRLRDRSPGR